MIPERWKRVNELFQAAVERAPAERAPFLAAACANDHELRGVVESLLQAHQQADAFLETPALGAEPAGRVGALAPLLGVAPGQNLGRYELVELLGAGGMGQVYRARDARMGRDVAVKVLARWFGDREYLERFRNEARALSALNHPNIVTIHDVDEVEGVPFLAMELIDGETLRCVLDRGRLTPRKALHVAAQVADGLAAAHARGIVHRDLKPENVMVNREGVAKILDFGLAKQHPLVDKDDGALSGEGLSAAAPSSGEPLTKPGTVLGTVGYMAPEQARGLAADFRADHFAYGALLYEVIAGAPAFQGTSRIETLGAILRGEPRPIAEVDSSLPAALGWILERCLAKDPEDRYGSTRDLARDVARVRESLAFGSSGRQRAAEPARRRPQPAAKAAGLLAALALLATAAALAIVRLRPARPEEPPRLRPITYSGSAVTPAMSPDGSTLAFASSRDGHPRIWLKHIVTGAEAVLTDGPDEHPRFSRDGATLLFTRRGPGGPALFRVSVLGGPALKLLDDARYGDWSPDGRHLAFVRFAREAGPRPYHLLGVAAADGSGGRVVHKLEAVSVRPPRWSPDSKRLAVTFGDGASLAWSILVLEPFSDQRRRFDPPFRFGTTSAAVWANGGRDLLYAQSDFAEGGVSGSLVLQDVASGRTQSLLRLPSLGGDGVELAGDARVIVNMLPLRANLYEAPIVARVGSRDVRDADDDAGLRSQRLSPLGGGTGRWLTRGSSNDRQPHYSADGARLAFSSNRDGQLDIWEVALKTGSVRRLTHAPGEDRDPRLVHDGRLLWSSKRSGAFEIWIAEKDGNAPRQLSADGFDAQNPAMDATGAWIVYASGHPQRRGLFKLRADGSGATPLAAGNLGLPEISPDGRYLLFGAFTPPTTTLRVLRLDTGETVPFEIKLPSATEFYYVIRGRARWMPDGRAIAFVDLDESGRSGVFVQDFVPGRDTSRSRRRLAGFDPEAVTESFAISPDGRRITLSLKDRSSDMLLVENLAGVAR
jgi:Tol biopolymer transport system component